MALTFGYTILYVPDVDAALTFYERAFGLKRRFLDPSGAYGELDTGGTALAFASEDLAARNGHAIRPHRPGEPAAAVELAFVTPDVDAAYARAVKAGAAALHPGERKPWGQTVATVRDCHGVLVELCTPMGGT